MDRTLLVYSTLTGNTKAVGEKIFEVIEGEKKIIPVDEVKNIDLKDFERVIVGFWVDKGNADKKSKNFIKSLENKKLAFFGTIGADPNSNHGNDVKDRVTKLCSERNNFVGGFLCRGKIDPKLVEKMGKFPLNLVHPLTPERLKRIEDAKSHPNENDFENAQNYFRDVLGTLK